MPVATLAEAHDRELLSGAADGDEAALAELYRRHADAGWRTARAVTRNEHDAGDALADAFVRTLQALRRGRGTEIVDFRAYLLATVRNAAVDRYRRGTREQPVVDAGVTAGVGSAGSVDEVIDLTDEELVGRAFHDLPERWQRVLWLTEVEAAPADDVAAQLGLSRNALAQLAFRARAGLRERYVQAHVQTTTERSCQYTVERLGGYTVGSLARGEHARVQQHLDECDECRRRQEQLADLGLALRRSVVPLGLFALLLGRWAESLAGDAVGAAGAAGAGGGSGTGSSGGTTMSGLAQSPLAKVVVAMAAAGLAAGGLVAVQGGDWGGGGPGAEPAEALGEQVVAEPAYGAEGVEPGEQTTGAERARGVGRGAASELEASPVPSAAVAGGRSPAPASPGGGGSRPPNGGGVPARVSIVSVSVRAAGHQATVAAGSGSNSCTGARVDATAVGCTEPTSSSVPVSVGG